jgi:hypothetical protein
MGKPDFGVLPSIGGFYVANYHRMVGDGLIRHFARDFFDFY